MLDNVQLKSDICESAYDTLNYWLCRFIIEVRRKDGSDYSPNTLINIVAGYIIILEKISGTKELSALRVGSVINRADPVTPEDEIYPLEQCFQ